MPSRRTALVVAGWFGSARRACSRGWRLDWPFSGAVGNHRTASPVNRCFWCWVLSDIMARYKIQVTLS